jgi:NDP-sugar pyrophosphorylase family protein
MKAMILAAGLGTRLRPLTNDLPKALVEINGRALLEITLNRLQTFGVSEVIVNVHHHAEKIIDYLESKNNFGIRIEISREDDLLLDTGGGLEKAAWFFLENNFADAPFVLHNVDVLSTIDLRQMLQAHKEKSVLATLAVQDRKSSRQLLFDENGFLCGRRKTGETTDEIVRLSPKLQPLAFSGVHIISPRLLNLITEQGVFSVIDVYLRLAASGEKISAFRADEYYWRDLGRPSDLTEAAQDFQKGIVTS